MDALTNFELRTLSIDVGLERAIVDDNEFVDKRSLYCGCSYKDVAV
jgi:hypothetical protein